MEIDLPPGSCNSTGHLSTIGYSNTGRMHHSASTPAGVDRAGGSGQSHTPPPTPKKGGKMLAVRVQMLDDTISMFQVQSKAVGRVLFDQVCKQLHLLEADYFGLEYQDARGTKYWLDVEKPMCRQLGLSIVEPALRFCVKFYSPDPARLEEEFTRYLFCLQVKRDLAQGCIQCNENTAALMASYIVQAECGDFVPEDYPDHTYLSGYKFFPGQDSESERRIMENHKKHIGQSPAEADVNLLETARRCELYGMKMHPAKDHENVALNLSVAHLGIVVFQNYTKINTFSWAKVRKISFKRKKFLIKLHPEGYGYFRDVVEFFFEGRNECKNFWKKCVENHSFFRCSSVQRLPRHKTRVMSRGSSFRYSGKTQKQIVEFVRDNYVKRQTFQRSSSFRASRSLRSSRVNVNTTMNASLSAHPLLPLPPGSDAISLEWDKQPHYLEASLMMKGYTEQAAREAAAAVRSGTRRSSEGANRPPATTCAIMRDRVAPELVTHAEVNHHPIQDSPLPHRTTTPLVSPESTWSQTSSRAATATITGTDHSQPPRVQEYTLPDMDSSSRGEADTLSSASFCTSPKDASKATSPQVTANSNRRSVGEAATSCNGLDQLDNSKGDANQNYENLNQSNGIINVDVVCESTNSIDVLSGGESDACDTMSRRLNHRNDNSMYSVVSSVRGCCEERKHRYGGNDFTYFITKEMLMTERTYKRDLELLTVCWSLKVSTLAGADNNDDELVEAFGRPCLALEPLALAQGALLARLERCLASVSPIRNDDSEEPEYRRIAELLCDYLSNTFDAYSSYMGRAGGLLARLESARRSADNGSGNSPTRAEEMCAALEATSSLPLSCLLLRPLHRLIYYEEITTELLSMLEDTENERSISGREMTASADAASLASELARTAQAHLRHAENHAVLCQLQRDILGYDKLLVAEREFIRFGCLYKHSSKGLQHRMLFLFSDIAVCASKPTGSAEFRVHTVLPVHSLTLSQCELPHTFQISNEGTSKMFSASNETEYSGWVEDLQQAIKLARPTSHINIKIAHDNHDKTGVGTSTSTVGGGLAHVCWHRATSLGRDHLHLATRTQFSGYLLRKFKNSHGWQKLWVVFAIFTLFFYKSWQDEQPLASLPLLGYSVSAPNDSDSINKQFVFKMQFKSHVYFFRADSQYTYKRWTEILNTATVHSGNIQ